MISTRNEKDSELLVGLQRANGIAVRQLYDLALPAVITYVKENSGNEADARDIFQEALMALYSRLEKGDFKLTCTLKSYLRIMCRNLWLTRLRRRGLTENVADVPDVEMDKDEGIEASMEQAERKRLYLKHFAQLGESCRKILSLFFEKTPVREMAKQLDTSESYIKKRKFQCKEQLIKRIQADPLFEEIKG
ncbi:MAG: RNA polymerase sigma factor [Saprospiraceae bacterium]